MRFKVRSLGGKLIIVAALTLLLCMLIFSALSWGLLKYLSEHEARSDATIHLSYLKGAYQSTSGVLLQDLTQVAQHSDVISAVSHTPTAQSRQRLEDLLAHVQTNYHVFLNTIDVVAKNHQIVGQFAAGQHTPNSGAPTTVTLL